MATDDDPPVVSRSPRGTIIVRIKRRAQVAVVRTVAAPLVKWAIGAVAAIAAAGWWAC